MEESIQKHYDAQRSFANKAFHAGCYAPFASLFFNTLGDVLACCKNETFVLGNVGRQRLDEIWGGDKIRTLRQSLSNYQFDDGCQLCEWQIRGGDHQGVFAALFEEFPVQSPDPEWPAMIEFAGSNTCNLECIMCYGELSSSIRSHREGLPPLPKAYSEEFFEDLRKFLPHLRRAKFAGGEPFLARECLRIWDMMIADGLTIPCHVTTNGSQYNEKVERVLEALPISLSISIDGASKETFERIRVNSRYETVMDNLHRFRQYTRHRGTNMTLLFCLMRQNWHEFGDLLLFAEELECEVFTNTVVGPSHCSLYKLPLEDLTLIADAMEKQDSSLKGRLRINRRVWQETVRRLRTSAQESQAARLVKALEPHRYAPYKGHVAEAKRLADKGMYAEALEEVLKTPKTHAHYYQSAILCGHLRGLLGDSEGAERDLDRAMTISPRRAEAFIKRARLRLEQDRLTEGLEDALRARELCKHDEGLEAEVCEVLSSLYERQGKVSDAQAVLDRLRELEARNREVGVMRGLIS